VEESMKLMEEASYTTGHVLLNKYWYKSTLQFYYFMVATVFWQCWKLDWVYCQTCFSGCVRVNLLITAYERGW
jgi:hypothetical protein